MSEWILRWQSAPRHWQWLTVVGMPLLLLLLITGGWLLPLQNSVQKLAQQSQQLQQQHDARRAQLQAQPSLAEQEQQNQQLRSALYPADDSAFSLVALVVPGAALEKWQPAAAENELTLLLDWPQFQQTLSYLASRQPPLNIHRFLLQRSGEQLRMTLSFGVDDEP